MMKLFPENIRKVGLFPLSLGDQGGNSLNIALKRLECLGVKYEMRLPEGGEYRYFAGSDEARAACFNALLADESIDLLFAIRGGVGAVRTLPFIDWDLLLERNIPVVGFSDMGGFLLPAWKKGFKNAISGKMAEATFGRSKLTDQEVDCCAQALYDCVYGKVVSVAEKTTLCAIKSGTVTAPVIPCCLGVFMSLIGTPWMPDLAGTILVLESINSNIHQVERALTQLEQCNILQSLGGLVFGSFTNCENGEFLGELFRDYGKIVPGPVCSNFKFGHEEPGAVIRVGGTATLSVSDDGSIIFA